VAGLNLVPVFLIGVVGSVHCIGMCGGIVSALSAAAPARPRFPVPVVVQGGPAAQAGATRADGALRVLSYNLGRIGSYAIAGALAGGLAQGARTFSSLSSLQLAGYWMANLMLVALGLYLMDAWRGLAHLEAAGQLLWRRIQPLMKPLLPMDSAAKALALGGLWGWIPCGMVYSVLLTAMMTGSAASGAAVMISFGLGTLPMLVGLGMLGARLRALAQRRAIRVAGGALVLAFGVLGLVRAANGLSLGWLDAVCVTPHEQAQP
jgi:sulfite exporter TauE/SafE